MSQAPVLAGIRPSAAAVCPRWASYQGLSAPASPRDPEAEGYAERGHQLEETVARRLRKEGRRYRRQVAVPFPRRDPFAIGHLDFVLPAERTIVEVHSNKGAQLEPHKALQVAIYACSRKGTQAAYVVAIDPSSLMERWWPIDYEAMRPQVDAIGDAIRLAVQGGPLPRRSCRYPGDSPGRWCPYRDGCFADWTWPEPRELLLVDDVVDALVEARADKADAARREDACKDLLAPFVQPDQEHRIGAYALRRTSTPGRDTFSLKAYLAAGHQLTDELAAFVNHGEPSERWTIRRTEDRGDHAILEEQP